MGSDLARKPADVLDTHQFERCDGICEVWRVENDLVVERGDSVNTSEVRQQLGVLRSLPELLTVSA